MATNIEYRDYDLEGSLMDQIERLIAAPIFETKSHRPAIISNRKSATSNSLVCNMCQDGGELICCDHCPASFHLQCHHPPLTSSDLPEGHWSCNRCKTLSILLVDHDTFNNKPSTSTANLKANNINSFSKSSKSSNRLKQLFNDIKNNKKFTEVQRNEIASFLAVKLSSSSLTNRIGKPHPQENDILEHSATIDPTPPNNNKSNLTNGKVEHNDNNRNTTPMMRRMSRLAEPFKSLCLGAAVMNSVEFDLPNELKRDNEFPGSYEVSHRNRCEKNKSLPHEPDLNGIISRPLKTCFLCSKSCRVGSLLQCDYCPLLFHLDCLDPPPTCATKEKWMCPNHVEHILDAKFLKSSSYSERLALWDKYGHSAPVDEYNVKLNFLEKTRPKPDAANNSETSRSKNSRRKVKIPDFVHHAYKTGQPTCTHISESQTVATSVGSSESDKKMDQETKEKFLRAFLQKRALIDAEKPDCKLDNEKSEPQQHKNGLISQVPAVSEKELAQIEESLVACLQSQNLVWQSQQRARKLPCYRSLDKASPENPVLAVLQPFRSLPALPLQSETISIGYGDFDINLARVGFCSKILNKHVASVHFDAAENRFELLPYCTSAAFRIDGLLLEKPALENSDAPPTSSSKSDEIIDYLLKPTCLCKEGSLNFLSRPKNKTEAPCWQGRAILKHGSVLEIGCLKFLFVYNSSILV